MEANIYTFRESENYEKDGFSYAEPPDYVEADEVYQGLPLEEEWKTPIFQMPNGEFPDYLDNTCRWILCSEKLRTAIDNFANNSNDITWLPVEVNNGETIKMYFALLIDFFIEDIIDYEKSKKLKNGDIYLPHFKYDKIKQYDLFIYDDKPSSPFLSESFKEKLMQANITGIGFENWYAS